MSLLCWLISMDSMNISPCFIRKNTWRFLTSMPRISLEILWINIKPLKLPRLFLILDTKNQFHQGIFRLLPQHLFWYFFSERKIDGSDNNGLSGSCFSRQYIQSITELHFSFLHQSKIFYMQATVSRDIRELKLTKVASKSGRQKYMALGESRADMGEKYVRIFKDGFVSMNMAQNILVIKTASGMAPPVSQCDTFQ